MSAADAVIEFEAALRARDIIPPTDLIADGKLHRCDAAGRNGKGDAAYILFDDDFPAGGFQNWRDGKGWENWHADAKSESTVTDRALYRRRMAEAQTQRDEEERQRYADAADRAAGIWRSADTECNGHPYLKKKHLASAHGARLYRDTLLVVPVRDLDGTITSLQFIDRKGTKRFLTGGRTREGCCVIGELSGDVIIVGESFSTAATLYEATYYPVVIAFNAGNLPAVAAAVRQRFPAAKIIIAADDDHQTAGNPGRTKAHEAAALVTGFVAIPDFGPDRPNHFTDFNDLGFFASHDRVREIIDAALYRATALDGAIAEESGEQNGRGPHDEAPQLEDESLAEGDLRLPKGFRLDPKTGLWFQPAARNDGEAPDPIWICAPFRILAATADEHNRSHGLLIEWTDDRSKPHRWALPRRLVHADGNIIASELEDAGQRCSTTRPGHEALKRFFGGVRINQYWRCVTRPGWHGMTYLLPSGRVFGDGTIVMQSESAAASTAFAERGTLAGWQDHVARYAVGNSLLTVSISSAFAGPFLEILNDPSGGLHAHGKSQTGKTTLLCTAASVWGPPDSEAQLRNWRATDNGLEGVAAQRCDGFLPLDETHQATPQDIINIIYTLSNQSGKARADRIGAARPIATWRVFLLSTGETTIAARVGEARKRTTAGSDVRLLNIPADGGQKLGVWQELHGFPDGGALTDHLRQASKVHCGTAGPAFLERLVADRAQRTAQWREASANFVREALGDQAAQADGQVRSAAVRFGLIAVAGEAAIEYGIVPWGPGTARQAALYCFARWRMARGGDKAAEDIAALRMLANVVATHGSSRFAPAHKPAINKWGDEPGLPRINNQLGYVELDESDAVIEYWFSAAVWRELCHEHGLEPGNVVQAVERTGFLRGATKRQPADKKRVWGAANPVRVYRIAADIVDYNHE